MMWSMMMWSLLWAFFMAALVVTLNNEHPSVSNRATTQLQTYTLYQRKISAEWCHSIDPLLLLALTAIDASVLPRFVPEQHTSWVVRRVATFVWENPGIAVSTTVCIHTR